MTLEIDRLGVCGFCHGPPRRDDEMLLVDSPVEHCDAVRSGLSADVEAVACGHTHTQFDRLAARRRVVYPAWNPYSYGQGPPRAK